MKELYFFRLSLGYFFFNSSELLGLFFKFLAPENEVPVCSSSSPTGFCKSTDISAGRNSSLVYKNSEAVFSLSEREIMHLYKCHCHS